MTLFGQEDVLRLQIAVDDALLVRGGEAAHDLEAVLNRLACGQGTGRHPRAQRVAVEQFRDRVRDAGVRSEVVNREDVGMRERRDRLGFAFEARKGRRILGELIRQNLDCDVAIERRVASLVDLAHAARANRRENLVRAETDASRESHRVP